MLHLGRDAQDSLVERGLLRVLEGGVGGRGGDLVRQFLIFSEAFLKSFHFERR